MKTDIRIVAQQSDEKYHIASISYDENNEVIRQSASHKTFETLEDCYSFIDLIYQASLKSVVHLNIQGEYE